LSTYFADTSALLKRYLSEVGSNWVKGWFGGSNIIYISNLTTIEMTSGIARRYRDGHISLAQRIQLERDFFLHVKSDYQVVDFDKAVIAQAINLVAQHPLRTLDAIQLACALIAAKTLGITPTFVSADNKLLSAAIAEGLPTDDPNKHP